MMYQTFSAIFMAASLGAVSAAPAPANPFNLATPVCGPPNSNGNGICVDHDAITAKPHAQYVSDNKHYLFTQCEAACYATSECVSIAYYNRPGGFAGAGWTCELLSVPVTPYTIKCGDPVYGEGATPFAQNNSAIGDLFNPASQNASALSNYFEKSCPPTALPQTKHNGTIPSADGDQLICGAYSTTQQSYADLYKTAPNNTQMACRDMCKEDVKCKSYWWQRFTGPSAQPFGQPQTGEPEINGDCAFFTQPARGHGVYSYFPLPIFDINCNLGNGTN